MIRLLPWLRRKEPTLTQLRRIVAEKSRPTRTFRQAPRQRAESDAVNGRERGHHRLRGLVALILAALVVLGLTSVLWLALVAASASVIFTAAAAKHLYRRLYQRSSKW